MFLALPYYSHSSAKSIHSDFYIQLRVMQDMLNSKSSLYKIRRIRKYLSYKSAQTLILALVIGRLDYCNSVLYGLPASYIIKLQRVQNAAARLISKTTRFDHISPVMKDLHWLPVKYRIMFKLVVDTFKALHGNALHIFIN